MPVPEELVSKVVSEVSSRMSDPGYGQLAVGGFIESQPDIGRFVGAHADELSGEGVIEVVFHAEVIRECIERHKEGPPARVTFRVLDECATEDALSDLHQREPALADYVSSNVESKAARALLGHIGLALHRMAERGYTANHK